MKRASSSIQQVPMRVPLSLVILPLELLEKVVALVALSSVKLEDDSLIVLASVSKKCHKVVLGWLMTTTAGKAFHIGIVLSPIMAGFFVHKSNGMWPCLYC
jgi:hypothetical protein